MRKLVFIYTRPQFYYSRLFLFFFILSLFLALFLTDFKIYQFDLFLIKFILIYFLLMGISILVEYFLVGDYMNLFEINEINLFFNNFLDDLTKSKKISNFNFYFNKYDLKSKKKIKFFLNSSFNDFYISSIRKRNNVYVVTFVDKLLLFNSFLLNFFLKSGIHKAYIKKIKGNLKIIYFD